jgi:Zn-dependent oligopeptidase
VRKFEVWESGSSATLPLGVIYMDLFSRAGKYGNAASFPLQFGRRLAPTSGNVNGSEGEYQMPKVCLSCSFDGGNLKRVSRQPPLLQHEEVEVLFHEFGHSLHFVLARTEMQVIRLLHGSL